MSRVLTTEQAKAAIGQVQSNITGGFTDQISALDAQGRVVSDPNKKHGLGNQGRYGEDHPVCAAGADGSAESFTGGNVQCRPLKHI
jgi:hypothetical protein